MNWKNVFKSWTGVPVLILVALAVVWVFTSGLPAFKGWQVKRAYEKLAEPYYKDTYGGKTPEETYDMFIDALKKGDVELASKYFVIEDQENWAKILNQFQVGNSLGAFIEERISIKNRWKKIETEDKNVTVFRYNILIKKDTTSNFEGEEINIPAGNYTNETIFNKYPSGVWKIATL